MSLKQTILNDLKEAMKAKNSEKVSTLRLIQAAIKNKEIECRPNEISEDDIVSVLKKAGKQRKDSIEQFQKAGRDDLVAQEQAELKYIESYLPEQLSADAVKTAVQESIADVGATSMKDMGAVMKQVLAKTKGQADNKLVSELVKELLG